MINPKFYKLAGWGMVISSFYFTWTFFPIAAVMLHNLVTDGGSGIFPDLTPAESVIGFVEMTYVDILLGVALMVGGIFVLKRMGTRTKSMSPERL